jgi:hypothetical protein
MKIPGWNKIKRITMDKVKNKVEVVRLWLEP